MGSRRSGAINAKATLPPLIIEAGVVGMSLNTHKAIANKVLEGGYEALNDYRKVAIEKLKELGKKKDAQGAERLTGTRMSSL